MKARLPLAIVMLAAFAAGAWMALRPPEFDEASAARTQPAVGEARATTAPAPSKLGAATVLAIDPRANPLKSLAPAAAQRVSLFNEFLKAKSYKPIYDRLKASGDAQTPEGWYVMYEMLRRCATVTDRRGPPPRATDPKRDEFIASIPAGDPQRDRRIAAFDDVTSNRCAGLESVSITQADLNKMLASAVAGGDPKAQALSIEQQLWAERRAAGPAERWGRDSVTLTDQQVAQLQQIATSRDPEAMVIAGRVLANSWHDFSMRIGGDQVIEQRAFNQAMQLLACDYGAVCGEDNARVLSACAYQGHCNASSLADYVYYYGSSPYDSQLLTQYREILRSAVESGNWSQISIVRGPTPPSTARFIFRPPGG